MNGGCLPDVFLTLGEWIGNGESVNKEAVETVL
jgi:hypothetical protein